MKLRGGLALITTIGGLLVACGVDVSLGANLPEGAPCATCSGRVPVDSNECGLGPECLATGKGTCGYAFPRCPPRPPASRPCEDGSSLCPAPLETVRVQAPPSSCPDVSEVDVKLGEVGVVTTLMVDFAPWTHEGQPLGEGQGACPTTFDASSTPVRYLVVQNTTSKPILLSTWAVCTEHELGPGPTDVVASLLYYRRYPVSARDKMKCVGAISKGVAGGGLGAPALDCGASMRCPGLTKENEGGIRLGVCESAAVRVQRNTAPGGLVLPRAVIRLRPDELWHPH